MTSKAENSMTTMNVGEWFHCKVLNILRLFLWSITKETIKYVNICAYTNNDCFGYWEDFVYWSLKYIIAF